MRAIQAADSPGVHPPHFDEFIELHGDRTFRDDGAIVGGIASLGGRPVTVIGTQKAETRKRISRATSECRTLKGIAKPYD